MDVYPGIKIDPFFKGEDANAVLFNIKYRGEWYLVNLIYPYREHYPNNYPPELFESMRNLLRKFYHSEAYHAQHPETIEFTEENALKVFKEHFEDVTVDTFQLAHDVCY